MKSGIRFLFALSILAPVPLSAVAEETLNLKATRLEVTPDEVRAEGRVSIRLGPCHLNANEIKLRQDRLAFIGKQVCLRAGGMRIEAHRLRLRDGRLDALHVDGHICSCQGDRPLLSFWARRARVAGNGHRLHLHRPTFRVAGVPLITLPYLPVPLRPGTSGIMLPELGFSGRDGVRLAQGIYLAPTRGMDLVLAGGWIQQRGGQASNRFRLFGGHRGSAELNLLGLRDEGRLRGQAQGRLFLRGAGWATAASPDLVSDSELLADLDRSADRVFAPAVTSRLWTWIGQGAFNGAGNLALYQQLQSPSLMSQDVHGQGSVLLGLVPLRLVGPVYLMAYSRVGQWILPRPDEDPVEASVVTLTPGIGMAHKLGPIRTSINGFYQAWGARGSTERILGDQSRWVHSGQVTAELSLPLARIFSLKSARVRHLVEPLVGMRWTESSSGSFHLPDGSRADTAQSGILGFRSGVWVRRETGARIHRILWMETGALLSRQIGQSLVSSDLMASFWAGSSAQLGIVWQVDSPRPARIQGNVCVRPARWITPCAGYHRLRIDRQGHLSFQPDVAWLPLAGFLPPVTIQADQISGSLHLHWEGFNLGGYVAGDPVTAEVTHGVFWLEGVLGCGCVRAGLTGTSRLGQRWPDLMVRVILTGGSEFNCWSSYL